jgi:hypothetical protein
MKMIIVAVLALALSTPTFAKGGHRGGGHSGKSSSYKGAGASHSKKGGSRSYGSGRGGCGSRGGPGYRKPNGKCASW